MGFLLESGRVYSVDPSTGSKIAELYLTSLNDIPEVVERTRVAQGEWARLGLTERVDVIRMAYRTCFKKRDEIAEIISRETGKPLVEAYTSEILPVLDCFKYYVRNGARILKRRRIPSVNPLLKLRRAFVDFYPVGIVAVISPWNFPFLLSMQQIIPALLAGNGVIHKPSELTSLTGLKLGELFSESGLPRNVLSIVTGLAGVGARLVQQPFDKISFTGSTEVGIQIYKAAAENLTPVNMELGGSDPMIVLEDANIERAANAAVWGGFSNAGQACVSVERLMVHSELYDTFVKRLREKIGAIKTGNTDVRDVAALANKSQFEKVRAYVQSCVDGGGEVLVGGKAKEDSGKYFVEPTLLLLKGWPKDGNADIEIFGPVITVMRFENDDEAIELANASSFGLSASVWTDDSKRAQEFARRLQVGSVLINELLVHLAHNEAPYSGAKKSGIGVTHGPWGLMEMTRPRYLSMETGFSKVLKKVLLRRQLNNNIWWFHYDSALIEEFKAFIHLLHSPSILERCKALPCAVRAFFRDHYL
jgi:succinate-semialdehyde dehydrogenase/glutarate-semialdehyde dehydrogenase